MNFPLGTFFRNTFSLHVTEKSLLENSFSEIHILVWEIQIKKSPYLQQKVHLCQFSAKFNLILRFWAIIDHDYWTPNLSAMLVRTSKCAIRPKLLSSLCTICAFIEIYKPDFFFTFMIFEFRYYVV